MAKQLPRIAQDLLTLVANYLEFVPAASSFKKWGGIFLISAALQRKVWTIADPVFGPLYPNLFTMLTGRPGSGKDAVIGRIIDILRLAHMEMDQGKGFQLSGQSLSPKGLIDLLGDEDGEFTFQYKNGSKVETVKYHSLLLMAGEFPTIMPVYNTQLIAFFNDLYNCGPTFTETVRGRGSISKVSMPNPYLGMLIGIQPATMFDLFPEQAFRMGFFSRLNLVYSEEHFAANPFDKAKPDRSHLLPQIITEVRSISQLTGRMEMAEDAGDVILDFANNNPGALKQSRYLDYNTRRWMHLTKLAMCFSVSASNSMRVELKHVEQALEMLTETEAMMPLVFDNIATSSGFEHTVEQLLVNSKDAVITQQQLERSLRRTHRPYEVGQIIASMIRSGDLEEIPLKTGEHRLPRYRISNEVKQRLQG